LLIPPYYAASGGEYTQKRFKKWFSTLDNDKEDRWVFIACDGGDAKLLLPFISTLADIAISSLVSLGVKKDRRIWFIFDELAKLKYLPALQENITILRKYGGCILAATQSFNQIFAHYGKNSGGAILSQFNTNIIFRISEVEEAKIIAKRIGEIEYLSHQKNTSYGAHEFRDGISYTEQEKKQDLVKVNDLSSLKPNQAFVLLPEPDVAISKVSLEIASKPQSLQMPFLNNPSVESMIEGRKNRWNEQASK
jgi:type IV secretory pathway TraG/TraD family ATPase VirD4